MRRLTISTIALVALTGMAALMGWAGAGLVAEARTAGTPSFDTLFGLAATACAAGCGVWLAAAAVLTVLGSLPGAAFKAADHVARWIAPTAWRRAIQVTLGLALVTGPVVVTPAWAENHLPENHRPVSVFLPSIDRPSSDPTALPPIDRPAAEDAAEATAETQWIPSSPPAPPATAPPASPLLTGNPRAAAVVEEHVVVRRGDSLWHIAGRYLGPTASAADIATEWPRWWNANRDVIGADPDLILPGQILRPPA
jgi:nucleoid-associated protein YgaU